MFGDLGLAETEATDQVADGARAMAEEFDNVQPVGLGECAEGDDHGEIQYASTNIFLSRNIPSQTYIKNDEVLGNCADSEELREHRSGCGRSLRRHPHHPHKRHSGCSGTLCHGESLGGGLVNGL